MIIKDIYNYREMIVSLVRKDLRGRYKGSVLGFLWTFVNPLLQLIVYSIVFSIIVKMGIDNFSMFLFVALVNHGMNPAALLFLPLIMLIEYILALGFSFVASAITVYFRDLEHILNNLSMAWMYLTPILYTQEMVPEQYKPLFNLNPMTPIIIAYRDILFYKRIPSLNTLIGASITGVVSLILGFILFNKLKKGFAEEM